MCSAFIHHSLNRLLTDGSANLSPPATNFPLWKTFRKVELPPDALAWSPPVCQIRSLVWMVFWVCMSLGEANVARSTFNQIASQTASSALFAYSGVKGVSISLRNRKFSPLSFICGKRQWSFGCYEDAISCHGKRSRLKFLSWKTLVKLGKFSIAEGKLLATRNSIQSRHRFIVPLEAQKFCLWKFIIVLKNFFQNI